MAAQKIRAFKAGKKVRVRKSRLWLRDLLNILGGLLVGVLGCWGVQEYLKGRDVRQASQKYLRVIKESAPLMKPFSEKFLALEEGRQGAPALLEDLDLSRPVFPLDGFGQIDQELPLFSAAARPVFWEFYLYVHDAELMRRLIREAKENPSVFADVLARGFLRSTYESSHLIPKLLWELKASGATE